tara:strand:+ start:5928 stop:6086 length:159 start_codon:yes stop_codon:yes gene_type:complete
MNKVWEIDWEYWEAQLEGYKQLKKKKRLWRDHKNENKEMIDAFYDNYWRGEK